MTEEWKTIQGFEKYEVSNLGKVRNKKTGRNLKGAPSHKGYTQVTLRHDGGQSTKKVHRLVAENFIPRSDSALVVNHKDENKFNNAADNLEWVTVADNNGYGNRGRKVSETWHKKTKAERSAIARDRMAQLTPAERSERMKKAWKTRKEEK